MSLLPLKTFASPGVSLFGSGGGGGGGVGPNLSVSTLTAAQTVNTSSLVGTIGSFSTIGVSSINGASYPPAVTDVFSTIQVSSINGLQYPPAQTDAFSTLTCSTLAVANTTSLNSVSWQNATNCGSIGMTGNSDITGAGEVQAASLNFISSLVGPVSYVSSIQNVAPSSTTNLKSVGIPRNSGVSPFNMIQAGYVVELPYASTVLFQYPYPDNNSLPAVLITPTNDQVTGGANPNISLNASYGISGVSTIGFSVDARDGGVGYDASFFWVAVPQTQ
jgi:hypothetical protein